MKFNEYEPWNMLPGGGGETGKLLVDPSNTKRLYISNPLDPAHYVIRSTDGGQNWTTIFNTNTFNSQDYNLAYATQKAFVLGPADANRLLLATNRVYETKNASAANPSWSPISNVLSPAPQVTGQYIRAVAIAPSDGKIIYASTADGRVWVTEDSGAHWGQRDAGILGHGAAVEMRVNPANAKEVFAVTNGAAAQTCGICSQLL